MGAGRLVLMLFVAFLLIEIAVSGKLGSLLGAIIDPANMVEGPGGAIGSTVPGAGQPSNTIANTAAVSLMISSVFGPYSASALKIANCESGLDTNAVNPTVVNGSQATGVFQILYPSTWSSTSYAKANPKDAMSNIQAAYEIFKRDGFVWSKSWACASKVGVQ